MSKRKIRIELQGPHVAEWIDAHVSPIGAGHAHNAGPIIGHSAYEKRAEWEIPIEDEDEVPSWRLLAQGIRAFIDVVPGARELLDKHRSGVKVTITGGPR